MILVTRLKKKQIPVLRLPRYRVKYLVEGKIPEGITGVATNSELDVVENKIPDVISLVTKTDFDAKLKKISDRFTSNKSKHLLVENELRKLKTLENGNQISLWKSKGLSNQYLNLVGTIGDIILSEPIKSMHVLFRGQGLLYQKSNDGITGGPIINIYIVYKTTPKKLFMWCS